MDSCYLVFDGKKVDNTLKLSDVFDPNASSINEVAVMKKNDFDLFAGEARKTAEKYRDYGSKYPTLLAAGLAVFVVFLLIFIMG